MSQLDGLSRIKVTIFKFQVGFNQRYFTVHPIDLYVFDVKIDVTIRLLQDGSPQEINNDACLENINSDEKLMINTCKTPINKF